eukprot:CAMPEP_0184669048 /NCGR_PEP_ID=MMETSP0308-20130426/75394_1 /TAXON_ID=38269 /ORGANISM="Gloeochaete witrockiana, Strain SAG 46.84" /LENGTH=240 /DNA_ID=CAMNT_0027115093 /DNA_START=195 /DNA_END=914 /DNA_ORIENTATION=+
MARLRGLGHTLVIISAFVAVFSQSVHRCEHDEIAQQQEDTNDSISPQVYSSPEEHESSSVEATASMQRRALLGVQISPYGNTSVPTIPTGFQPIRIYFDTSQLDTVVFNATLKAMLRNTLSSVKAYWERTLTVQRIAGNLTAVGSCQSSYTGTINVPDWYGRPGMGIANTDLVIYVVLMPFMGTRVTAWACAAWCVRDQKSRPIWGFVAFNTLNYFSDMTARGLKTQMMVATHEVTHVLG